MQTSSESRYGDSSGWWARLVHTEQSSMSYSHLGKRDCCGEWQCHEQCQSSVSMIKIRRFDIQHSAIDDATGQWRQDATSVLMCMCFEARLYSYAEDQMRLSRSRMTPEAVPNLSLVNIVNSRPEQAVRRERSASIRDLLGSSEGARSSTTSHRQHPL